MFCEKCGTKVQDGQMFCPACGASMMPASGGGVQQSIGYQQGAGGQQSVGLQPAGGSKKSNKKVFAVIGMAVVVMALVGAAFVLGRVSGRTQGTDSSEKDGQRAGSAQKSVEEAVKTYVDVFLSGEKRDSDVKWTKYYPKDFERELDAWAEEYADSRESYFWDVENYKVLSVSKLSSKDLGGMLEDMVDDFFMSEVPYYSGKVINKRDLRDTEISDGYAVLTQFECDGNLRVVNWLVIEVNGCYGVYGSATLWSE